MSPPRPHRIFIEVEEVISKEDSEGFHESSLEGGSTYGARTPFGISPVHRTKQEALLNMARRLLITRKLERAREALEDETSLSENP